MKPKVLIIDDEPDMIEIIHDLLQEFSDSFEFSSDGKDALEKAERFQPDLIVSDLNMPTLNGIDFLREIRRRKIQTPIIFISGRNLPDFQPNEDLGPFLFFAKPFDYTKIQAAIAKILTTLPAYDSKGKIA